MKKKELLEEVENFKITICNLCMTEITLERRIEELEKENKQLKQELVESNGNLEFKIDEKNFWKHECVEAEKQNNEILNSIKTQLEIYFKNKSLRPVTKAEMLLDAFYQLLNRNQQQDYNR